MAKAPTEIRSLARAHTHTALKVLAGIMKEESAPHASRVSAAQALLDRGWGKPTQPFDAEEGLKEALAGITVRFGAGS
jgi:hypothetical protein